jgi:hypothetical protein
MAAHDIGFLGRTDEMKLLSVSNLCVLAAAMFIASFNATPADARSICKGSGANAKCYTAKKKFAKKRAKARTAIARPRRIARLRDPWHGWAGSFHLDGVRYPGGNPSGPAFAYNNYEGGFHPTAFWVLSDRGRH